MSKVDFIDILAVETKYTCYNTEPSLNLICMAWWPTCSQTGHNKSKRMEVGNSFVKQYIFN